MKTLLETADVCDSVHDAVFEVGLTKYPAHRYVMAFASNVFEEMLDNAPVVDGVAMVKVTDVLPETFKRILVFAYTNDCDLLRPYSCSARLLETQVHIDYWLNFNERCVFQLRIPHRSRG